MADERFASVSGTRSLNSPLARSTVTSLRLGADSFVCRKQSEPLFVTLTKHQFCGWKGGEDCLQAIFGVVIVDQFVPLDVLEVAGIIFRNPKHVFLHYDHQKTGYPQGEELTLALSL